MGDRLSIWTRGYLALIIFSVLGLAVCRVLHRDPGPIAPVTAALTLVTGVIAVFRSMSGEESRRALWAFAGLIVLGAGVEIVGASTGLPFGRYVYTDRWKPAVHLPEIGWFPLLVPLAWSMMVAASTLVVVRLDRGSWTLAAYALLAGLLGAAVDLVMEPVLAGPMDYWRWIDRGPLPGGAPMLNLLGWFAASAAGSAILLAAGARGAWRRFDGIAVLTGHLLLLAGMAAFAGDTYRAVATR